MFVTYEPSAKKGCNYFFWEKRFPRYFNANKPNPSSCLWIIPGTVSPLED